MCGIFGVYNFSDEPIDKVKFTVSTNKLAHRGPDGEGYYWDNFCSLALGHRRLSIIDIESGHQPMCNENESVWITFNGEIYNYLELKEYLISKGHIFKTKCDTEVLIHGYEEFGEELPKKLNGIFAFAIWDKNKKYLLLARDHFGVKPLYYLKDGKRIIFSSEIKSIINYTGQKPKINLKALNLCLTIRHTPSPFTLFEGINKLPACSTLLINNKNELIIKNYWEKRIKVNKVKSEKEWIESLSEKLENSVQKQMMSDVPIGISLSGGMDSGALLAISKKYNTDSFFAYTIGFEGLNPKKSEYEKAKTTAELFNSNFVYQVISAKNYSDIMEKFLYHLEEPIGNESSAAYYFVAKLAYDDGVKVLLNGQGADEPFASYDRYIGMNYYLKYPYLVKLFVSFLDTFKLSSLRKNQIDRFKDYISKEKDVCKIASAANVITGNQKLGLLNNDIYSMINDNEICDHVESILDDNIEGNVIEKMMFYDMFTSLSDNLLLCEDKMSMAASVEARVPYLDVDFITEALSVPLNMKIKNGSSKYILKKVCEKYLSNDIIYQKKIGFDTPMDKWLNTHLREELRDYIFSINSISKNYLNICAIEKLLSEHSTEKADNTKFLFLLLSLEKWRNTFFE